MALILMRHTTPDIDAGICYGRTDLDVAASFTDEAEAALATIARPTHIFTSPLRRCRILANHAGAYFDIAPKTDDRLQEMDFGTWEGQPWDQIARAELDQWAADFFDARPHGGESVRQMQIRVHAALTDCRASPGPVLLVTHAGVLKTAAATTDHSDPWNLSIPFGGVLHVD